MTRRFSTLVVCAFLSVAATGCDRLIPEKKAESIGKSQEALKVSVVEPTTRSIVDYEELNGRTAAVESVDVRAQVSGYLEEICFRPGATVKTGDVLFKLDSNVYAAVVEQRKADVVAQEVELEQARLDWNRQKELNEKAATPRQDLELAETKYKRCEAELAAAKANLNRAQIDLDYATIQSPIDGVVSREQITVGNLVETGSTLLTSVVAVDPLYIFFDVDERTLLDFRRNVLPRLDKDAFTVKFAVGDEKFDREAKVDFNEPRLNETTGTLEFRSVADNKPNDNGTRGLLPGVRLRVLFPTSLPYDATLIPEEAILTDQNVKYVFTVDAENNAVYTPIKLGALQNDNMRVVLAGLEPGARVVTNQLLKVRAGSPVEPTLVETKSVVRVIREDGTFYNADGTSFQDELATTEFVGEGKKPAAESSESSEIAPAESASETPKPQN